MSKICLRRTLDVLGELRQALLKELLLLWCDLADVEDLLNT